ncbi:MAG: endo-1,4-beta-xylanase [candidate division WOR-3 bacterium]|jgi:endo-1,4-beta-xylanase
MNFKRLIIVIGVVVLAMTIVFSMGCQNQPTGPEGITKMESGNLPVPSKTRASFLGNITYGSSIPTDFAKYWNQVTPENEGKWDACERNRDQYSWSNLDVAYDFARRNGFKFKQHCLIWGSQEPSWISGLSQSEQRAEVEEWIRDFGNRYSPDLVDVVNEPLHQTPSFRDALGGTGSTGWDWVVESFRLADQYVSGTKILNEYNILNGYSSPGEIIEIADAVKNGGVSLAIGCQAHSIEDVSANDLRSRLNQIRNAGYSVYVSELDIRGSDSEQLRIYQNLFPIIWENSAGVTLWGYLQGHTWRSEAYLVSSDGSHRPAMDWLMDNYGGGGYTTTTSGYTTTTTTSWNSTTTTSGYTTTTTGGGSNSIVLRARGVAGSEHIYLEVGGNQIGDWTVSTSYQNYSASTNNTGDISVCFDNDDGENRDVQVDYITINGETRQAEDQSYNTGVWQDGSCGGEYSEWLHCEGCIGFGDVSGGGSTTSTTTSWSSTTTSGGYTTTTSGGGSNSIAVRARGEVGDEHIYLEVDGNQIADWTVSTSYQNYTASTDNTGGINVCFDNDSGDRDVQIDYIEVNGETRQAEDQEYNTGAWANNECGGGSYTEWLHCDGCIGFGDVSGGGGSTTSTSGGYTSTTTTSGSSWWGDWGSWW